MVSAYPNPKDGPPAGEPLEPGPGVDCAPVWDESLRIGDDQIDHQHQTFFHLLAEVRESAERGDDESLKRHLDFLAAYAVLHFQDEERFMAACHFPGLAEHRRVHQAFVAQVAGHLRTYEADPATVTVRQILSMIQDWLISHILGMDKQIRAWVEERKAP